MLTLQQFLYHKVDLFSLHQYEPQFIKQTPKKQKQTNTIDPLGRCFSPCHRRGRFIPLLAKPAIKYNTFVIIHQSNVIKWQNSHICCQLQTSKLTLTTGQNVTDVKQAFPTNMTELLQVGFNYKMTGTLFNAGTVQSVRLRLWIGWQLFSNLQLVWAIPQLLGDKLPSHQATNHPVIESGRCGPAGCCNYLESAIKFDLKR